MTTHNQPKRPHQRAHTTRSFSAGTPSERESVPHARDELERERELYSAHDPNRDPATPTPAQKWNEAHNSWHGWQGTGSIPAVSNMRGTGSIPAVGSTRTSNTPRAASGAGGIGSAGGADGTSAYRGGTPRATSSTGTPRGSYSSTGSTGAPRSIRSNGKNASMRSAPSGSGRVFAGSSREYLSGDASATGNASTTGGIPASATPASSNATGSIPVAHNAAITGGISSADEAARAAVGGAAMTGAAVAGAAAGATATETKASANTARVADTTTTETTAGVSEHGASSAASSTTTTGTEQNANVAANNNVLDGTVHSETNDVQANATDHQNTTAQEETSKTTPTRRISQKPAAVYGANNRYQSRGSVSAVRQTRLTRTGLIAALAVVVVAIIGVFAFQNYEATKAVAVTLNGESVTVEGDQRSPEGILNAGLVSVTPGNYVAVDKSVIREGEGTRATVTLNGEKTDDLSTHLEEGDEIKVENGTDVMESFTEGETEVLPYSTKITGTGAVHLYMNKGKNGEKVVRTGDESGIKTETVTQEPVNRTIQCYNVDTGGDKVIALTFDDGPWDSSTEKILDILDENDAKATFFTVGYKIAGHEDLVKRAAEAGHEIGTHTWDHAEGSGKGVSLIKMSSDERKEEVTKGLKAIEDATGSKASTVFRAPGGNFDDSVATDLQELISAEIGWNIDTNDWQKPGASTVAKRIESAGAGNIILMHDGGGDRSQTVAALKEALPVLKDEGYSFITVQELIEKYPYKES